MLQKLIQLFKGQQKQKAPDNIDEHGTESGIASSVNSRYTGLVDAVQSGWFLQDTDELFKGFTILSEDIVLDVGCGEGGATLFCANRGAHVVFSDTEQASIDALTDAVSNTSARACEGFVSDTNPLPLADQYVSKVIAMEMLEHVDDPKKILQELVRVGKPGAQYLLSVPAAAAEELQKAYAPTNYFKHPNHIHIFQPEEFKELITDAGLIIEQHHSSGFYWVIWMSMFWACERNAGVELKGAVRDKINPPFYPILDNWSSVWLKLITTPEGREVKESLDAFLPKTQLIIARKAT